MLRQKPAQFNGLEDPETRSTSFPERSALQASAIWVPLSQLRQWLLADRATDLAINNNIRLGIVILAKRTVASDHSSILVAFRALERLVRMILNPLGEHLPRGGKSMLAVRAQPVHAVRKIHRLSPLSTTTAHRAADEDH